MDALNQIMTLLKRPEFDTRIMGTVLREQPNFNQHLERLNEFVNAFMPMVGEADGNAQMVQHSAAGLMGYHVGGEDISHVGLPGASALRWQGELNFREAVRLSERNITELFQYSQDGKTENLQGTIQSAITMLRVRMLNRMCDIVRQSINSNQLVISGTPISETGLYSNATRSNVHLDLNASPTTGYTDVRDLPTPYSFTMETTNYLWNEANANILRDLSNLVKYITEVLGRDIAKIWFPTSVWQLLEQDAKIHDLLKYHDTKVLTDYKPLQDMDLKGNAWTEAPFYYNVEKITESDITLGSSTTVTLNTNDLSAPSTVVFYPKNSKQELYTSVSAVGSTTATIVAVQGSGTIPAGSRAVFRVPVVDNNKIVVELADKGTQYTGLLSIPAGGAIERPGYGYFTQVEQSGKLSNPYIDIFGGYNGRIDVYKSNFVTLKVT